MSIFSDILEVISPRYAESQLSLEKGRRELDQQKKSDIALQKLLGMVVPLFGESEDRMGFSGMTGPQASAPMQQDAIPGVNFNDMQSPQGIAPPKFNESNLPKLPGMGMSELEAPGMAEVLPVLAQAFPNMLGPLIKDKLFPAPDEFFDATPGVDAEGNDVFTQFSKTGGPGKTPGGTFPKKTNKFSLGETREIKQGGNIVTQEYDGNTWVPLSTAPAWQPREGGGLNLGTGYGPGPQGNTGVMIPGGPAAVKRAETLVKPVVDSKIAYDEAFTSYATMADLAEDTAGTSDISLVFSFFKSIDPESTVREGEFATVGQKMGLPAQIIGQMNTLTSGKGFLTPEVRRQLVDTAGRSIANRKKKLKSNYNLARKALDPLSVDVRTFLPFSVEDVDIEDVRKEFPTAQLDNAGRAFALTNGKRFYIELDE
jgi:hypothetical protein